MWRRVAQVVQPVNLVVESDLHPDWKCHAFWETELSQGAVTAHSP